MIQITAYVVAETVEKAEALISGTYDKYGRPWTSTLPSRGAARLYAKDIARVPANPKMRIFPFVVTFEQKAKGG
jgi:hypothetical protein